MQCLRHKRFARLLPFVLTTAALALEGGTVEHPEIATHDSAFRGVWYGCGTENALPGRKYVYAGGKATYSAWHHPMAVYAPEAKKTFFVFGDAQNRPAVSYYDHTTGDFAPPLALGTNPDGNAHRNPTMLMDEDGFLYVFYGYAGGAQPIMVLRSAAPYDIGRWQRRADLTAGTGSYAQPWQLKPGEIFVAHRQPSGWAFKRSTDRGASWTPAVGLAEFDTYEFTSTVYGITVAAGGDFPRAVHFAWSRLGGGSPEAVRTKHLWARRYNVYYARSDDGGDTWRRSDGTPYTLPITEDAAEKIYDSGEHGVWLKDLQVDPEGNPCMLFLDADTDTYASAWKFARHHEGRWTFSDVASSDHMYDGGALVLVADDDFRVYGPTTAVQPGTDGGEIDEWRSADQGRTWKRTARVTTGSAYSHNHVKTVFNHEQGHGDFRVLWSYGDARFPPQDRDVFLYAYGETMPQARRIWEP